jgi:hypothetical protein
MSKGSRNRTTDWKAYRSNYDQIFGIKVPKSAEDEIRRAIASGKDMLPIVLSDAVPDDTAVLMKDGQVQGVLKSK